MNYERVYSDFIKDRKRIEAVLVQSGEYLETHHIKPKALGGSNHKSNLIKLTPEDHIRAHLLLAKIHGGAMWAPLVVMMSGHNIGLKKIPAKRAVKFAAMARSKHGQAMRGYGNPFFGKKHTDAAKDKISDQRIYVLKHESGVKLRGCQRDLAKLSGIGARNVSRLVNGERNVCKGWFCPSINPTLVNKRDRIRESWRVKQEKITLYHESGEIWTGYPVDAPFKFSDFVDKNIHCHGWFRSERDRDEYRAKRRHMSLSAAIARGDISGLNNPRADKRKYKWENAKTGDIMVCTRVEAWKDGPLSKSGIASVMSGRQKQTGGWIFLGEAT